MSIDPAGFAHGGGYSMIETVRIWMTKDDEYIHFLFKHLLEKNELVLSSVKTPIGVRLFSNKSVDPSLHILEVRDL